MHTTNKKSHNPQAQEKMLLKKGLNIHGKPIKKSKLNKARNAMKNSNKNDHDSGSKRGPKKGTKRNIKGREKENVNNRKKRKQAEIVETEIICTDDAMKRLNTSSDDDSVMVSSSSFMDAAVVNPYDAGF